MPSAADRGALPCCSICRGVRAIARAWDWLRRLETGEVATLQDLTNAEKVTLPFVSRFIRLAYLSPIVLERIMAEREGIAVSLDRLAAAALDPWARQPARVFDAVGPGRNVPGSKPRYRDRLADYARE